MHKTVAYHIVSSPRMVLFCFFVVIIYNSVHSETNFSGQMRRFNAMFYQIWFSRIYLVRYREHNSFRSLWCVDTVLSLSFEVLKVSH